MIVTHVYMGGTFEKRGPGLEARYQKQRKRQARECGMTPAELDTAVEAQRLSGNWTSSEHQPQQRGRPRRSRRAW
jgi:hypothetical protein